METQTNPYIITDEMVDDIMDAAFYGCTYWVGSYKVIGAEGRDFDSSALTQGGVIVFSNIEDGGRMHYVSLLDFKLGIKKAAEYKGLTAKRFYDDHDSDDADMALQFAIFGKLVYG